MTTHKSQRLGRLLLGELDRNDWRKINVAACKALLDQGADLDQRDSDGNTALMLAARHAQDHIDRLVIKIIAAGADVDAVNTIGDTALHVAVRTDDRWGVQYLIHVKYSGGLSDPDMRNNDGDTPLLLALRLRRTGAVRDGSIFDTDYVVSELLRGGSDLNAENSDGVKVRDLATGGAKGTIMNYRSGEESWRKNWTDSPRAKKKAATQTQALELAERAAKDRRDALKKVDDLAHHGADERLYAPPVPPMKKKPFPGKLPGAA